MPSLPFWSYSLKYQIFVLIFYKVIVHAPNICCFSFLKLLVLCVGCCLLMLQDYVRRNSNQRIIYILLKKKNGHPNILCVTHTWFSNSRQYDLPKIWELLNVTFYFNWYLICDVKHQFVGLDTVLQLLGGLKSMRLSYCVSVALYFPVVSEILWEAHRWRITGSQTQQRAYYSISFYIKAFSAPLVCGRVWNCPVCPSFDNRQQWFCFESNLMHTWDDLLRLLLKQLWILTDTVEQMGSDRGKYYLWALQREARQC